MCVLEVFQPLTAGSTLEGEHLIMVVVDNVRGYENPQMRIMRDVHINVRVNDIMKRSREERESNRMCMQRFETQAEPRYNP